MRQSAFFNFFNPGFEETVASFNETTETKEDRGFARFARDIGYAEPTQQEREFENLRDELFSAIQFRTAGELLPIAQRFLTACETMAAIDPPSL